MRVLIAGKSTPVSERLLSAALDRLHARRALSRVIHTDATDLDRAASAWAAKNNVIELVFNKHFNAGCRGADPLGRMFGVGLPTLALLLPGYPLTLDLYLEHTNITIHRIKENING